MADFETVSDFVRAIRLLHSRAKDSSDVLKTLLDEVIKSRTNQSSTRSDQKKVIKGIEIAVIKSSLDYKKEFFDKGVDKMSNKTESFEYPMEKKRKGFESTQTSRSTSSSPTPGSGLQLPPKLTLQTTTGDEWKRSTSVTVAVKMEEDSEATDIEDENTDAGEFAVVMGLACVQCKQIDIAPNNQLVECQECHALYHQECHKPPLVDQDVSDPRFVWYCAKCQKTMKKIAVKPSKASAKGPVLTTTAAPVVSQPLPGVKTPVKGDNGSDTRLMQPFKREPKVSVPNMSFQSSVTSSSSAKPIGLAALATLTTKAVSSITTSANIKSKNGNNNSNNSTTSSTTAPASSGAAFMSAAEKRLQSLKKNKSKKMKQFL